MTTPTTPRVTCPACGRSLRPAKDRYRPHRIPGSNYVVCLVGTPQPYGPPVHVGDPR